MSQYKIDDIQFKKFRKRYLLYYLPLVIVIAVVPTAIYLYRAPSTGIDIPVWPFVLLIIIPYYLFSMNRTLRLQRRLMKSYVLTVSDTGISREQYNTQTISISFMEIREIIRTKRGGFIIRGLDRTDTIQVPHWVDETGQLEKELQTLAPIATDVRDPLHLRYRSVLSMISLAMFIGLILTNNKIIVAICGIGLPILLIWSLYQIQTSKNVTQSAKLRSWIYLLIIAGILYMSWIKFTIPN
jgi:hypothetical protein